MVAGAMQGLTDRIESSAALDRFADLTANTLDRILPKGKARDIASGVPLGHPAHPILVAIPIGSWSAASWLDLTGGDRKAARRLVALGIVTAIPAALTGSNDWLTTTGAERRVGLVHAALNDASLFLYGASWLARRRERRLIGGLLSLAGLAVTGSAGWLGGHLAYALGVGVDTSAFQQLPQDWTDVAAESDVGTGRAIVGDANGLPVLLTADGGSVVALSDRCNHCGAPLHEGEIVDGSISCPRHGSRFAFDGSVCNGPATYPQPRLAVRIMDGRVQVRRENEPRASRTNQVGS